MLTLTSSQPRTHEHFYRYSPCRRVTRSACASVPEQGPSLIFLQNALQHDVTAKEQEPRDLSHPYTQKITILIHSCMKVYLYCHMYNSIQNQPSLCHFSSDNNRTLTYSSTNYFQKCLLNYKCTFHIT